MQMRIKRIAPKEYDFVLELNRKNVEFLFPMDRALLDFFVDRAAIFNVLYAEDVPAAFLIALREGLREYDLHVYQWFSRRYETFFYVDQIVIDAPYRGMGIGRRLYQDLFDRARAAGIRTAAAAIETEPCNTPSLLFHKRMGFYEVGEQAIRGGTVKVSLQLAEVPAAMGRDV